MTPEGDCFDAECMHPDEPRRCRRCRRLVDDWVFLKVSGSVARGVHDHATFCVHDLVTLAVARCWPVFVSVFLAGALAGVLAVWAIQWARP